MEAPRIVPTHNDWKHRTRLSQTTKLPYISQHIPVTPPLQIQTLCDR